MNLAGSVDRDVKMKQPLLLTFSWGLGWGSLVFMVAVTLVFSDLVS